MNMKKTNKFILGAALTSGVIACFGAAFATYKKLGSDISIGIGEVKGHTDSSDVVTYKIGTPTTYKSNSFDEDNKIDLTTTKLSPELNKLYINVPLSFEYGDNLVTSAQETAVGHLNVKVDIDSAIAAKGTTVTANLKGYSKDGGTKETYFTTAKMNNFFSSKNYNDSELTVVDGFVSQSGYIDTAVDVSNISCVICIDMSSALSDTDKAFLDLANIAKAFKVAINWSPYQETAYSTGESWTDAKLAPTAYVCGDRSDWQTMEDYRMVPNINASKVNASSEYLVEWKYTVLKDFSTIKVYDSKETVYGDTWLRCRGGHLKDGTNVSIDDYGNATLDSTDSYNVYYTRNATSDQGFWVDSTSYVAP